MLGKELLAYVDHTLLRPTATWDDIKEVCDAGVAYKTASVCIPPDFVASAHEAYPKLNICTVIGFPLGYETTEVKVAETKQAIEEGASEIDMVINLGDVKQGDFEAVTNEIGALKEACGDGADYIKTSTGFGSGGASLEDIRLFKKHIGPNVQIKAAGGIRSITDMKAYIAEGCSRIGASAAVELLKDHLDEEV